MSEYPERYVRLGNETAWGTYATPSSFDPINFCLGFDATTVEERLEEDIIVTSRQARSRVWVQRAVAGAFEANVFSPRLLYYALGWANSDSASPYTVNISGSISLPSFSIERGLKGVSDTVYTGYMGCKIDRYELLIEREEDIIQTVDWVGSDNTFPTYTAWSTVCTTIAIPTDAYPYHQACLKWGATTLNLHRLRLEVNNNLVPRYSGTCASGNPVARAIAEGLQAISGDFIIDRDIKTFANTFAKGRTEGTIVVTIANATRGTMVITIRNVALDEFADAMRGMDVYEVTFPWTARPSSFNSYDAITIVHTSTIAGTIHDFAI